MSWQWWLHHVVTLSGSSMKLPLFVQLCDVDRVAAEGVFPCCFAFNWFLFMVFQWEHASWFRAKVNFTRILWNLRNQFFLAISIFSRFLFMVVWDHLLTIAIQVGIEVETIGQRGSFGSLGHLVLHSGRVVLTIRSADHLWQKFVIKTTCEGLSHPDFLFLECNMIIISINTSFHSFCSCFEFLFSVLALGKRESFIIRGIKIRILQFCELERRFLNLLRWIIEAPVSISVSDIWLQLGISLVEILLRLSWGDAILECLDRIKLVYCLMIQLIYTLKRFVTKSFLVISKEKATEFLSLEEIFAVILIFRHC